ncbi:interferon-induced GTP-binding protein Mx1 [Naviculisporaceae sp. PSN 640]
MAWKEEDSSTSSLGSLNLLNKIDRLRDLNIGHLVPLPQIVAVGDQSSGKSSVLESLTGFRFPRAPGLCTRYVTQITCRRVTQESVSISIIPSAGASDIHKEQLSRFRKTTTNFDEDEFGQIFREASEAMGIRSPDDDGGFDANLDTFSDDILKIEVNGPQQTPFTVIDVPGIFRAATPGLTTESDIQLVRTMVERAIKDDRTIILAVVPCNVDIATQEILKMAKDADPDGSRTMGVLTKPDLATERATQQCVIDLVQGKRQYLRLGYCVVKNRSADDEGSSMADRNNTERVFFKAEPWCQLEASNRTGINALKERLSGLIHDVTRKEFPRVREDIQKRLNEANAHLQALGKSRGDASSQRSFLADIARVYQEIANDAFDAKYNRRQIFDDSKMKLITRVREANEAFAKTFSVRGHRQHFEKSDSDKTSGEKQENEDEEKNEDKKPKEDHESDGEKHEPPLEQQGSRVFKELEDILIDHDYVCPKPENNIMDCIKEVYASSRGAELGTFGGNLLTMTFKTQTEKWEHIACPDQRARTEIWNQVLLEKLQDAYQKAMDHANFLIDVERSGTPITLNGYFADRLDQARGDRFQSRIKKMAQVAEGEGPGRWFLSQAMLDKASLSKSGNDQNTCRDVHDILQSYYSVSRKRFVDTICQQVVYHYLLESKESPLRLFDTKLVLDMSDEQLEGIAGEDQVTQAERERLAIEVKSMKAALTIIRG